MEDFAKVIMAFGSPSGFAAAIGITDSHARVMLSRNSIPPEYWQAVTVAAQKIGQAEITYDLLAGLAARRRPSSQATAPGAAA